MIDSQTVRWGIIGPGRIASQVIKDFPYVAGADAVAVASRSAERAQAFATQHGLARAYGSYQEIMADEGVDVVYISTPHPQHHAIALAAIAAGKSTRYEFAEGKALQFACQANGQAMRIDTLHTVAAN